MSTLLSERRQPITPPRLLNRAPVQCTSPQASARPEPAPAIPHRPVVMPPAYASLILGLIVTTLREWRRRQMGRRELARLDGRTLRDIGLDPGAVHYEARRWFWRPPRDLRD